MAYRFPAAWLDELRSRADIVQLVGRYVPLKQKGGKHWGLCPFHQEKTASFSVDSQQGMYYCFGCHAGGSIITFIMEMERLTFPEAVKFLADLLHVELPDQVPDDQDQLRKSQRERLQSANREAAKYFHQQLFTPAGAPILAYLKNRGLSDGVIRRFGIGAALADWDDLTRHLTDLGYTTKELAQAGLTVVKENGEGEGGKVRAFDMFRNRAIFPIIDQRDNVLAFGGRAMGDAMPKYLNTSDTPVFNKRLGVYGANLLRKERHLERVVLVEGYMDVVALSQFGVRGVVATLGTALTPEQARLLKRYAPQVHLAYDGDAAGQNAILKGLEVLAAEGVPARVVVFPDGLDPDEFIRRDGLEGFDALPTLSPAAYRIQHLRQGMDLSTEEGRMTYARSCAAILRPLDPVEVESHLKDLVIQTGFSREVLLQQIGSTKLPPAALLQRPRISNAPAHRAREKVDLRPQELLISILATGRIPMELVEEKDFSDPLLNLLCRELKNGVSPAALAEAEREEADRQRVVRLMLTPMGESGDQLMIMAKDCLNTLRKDRIERRLKELMTTINTLHGQERMDAMGEVKTLTAALQKLKNMK